MWARGNRGQAVLDPVARFCSSRFACILLTFRGDSFSTGYWNCITRGARGASGARGAREAQEEDRKLDKGSCRLAVASCQLSVTVTALETKARLGELLARVGRCEEFIITRHDKPVAGIMREAGASLRANGLAAC